MKYLFLDTEWNQNYEKLCLKEDRILEIGGYYMDGEVERMFFSFVRPKDGNISDRSLQLLKITRAEIEAADNESKTIERLRRTITDFCTLVVWNNNTYRIFMQAAKKAGIKFLFQNVIILQRVIVEATEKPAGTFIGFTDMLDRYGVHYDANRLHNSGYDAESLKNLYFALESRFAKFLDRHDDGLLLRISDIYNLYRKSENKKLIEKYPKLPVDFE